MLMQHQVQEQLGISQILEAIVLLTPDEKDQLSNLLPLFLSSNGTGKTYLQEFRSIENGFYECNGVTLPFDELSNEQKAEILKDWLASLFNIKVSPTGS